MGNITRNSCFSTGVLEKDPNPNIFAIIEAINLNSTPVTISGQLIDWTSLSPVIVNNFSNSVDSNKRLAVGIPFPSDRSVFSYELRIKITPITKDVIVNVFAGISGTTTTLEANKVLFHQLVPISEGLCGL